MRRASARRLAELTCYRKRNKARLTAAIEMAEVGPGVVCAHQALLYTGQGARPLTAARDDASRPDLCGSQLCMTPDAATFELPRRVKWLDKYLAISEIDAEVRRRLFAFARVLLDSGCAGTDSPSSCSRGHPQFAHLLAVYNNYDSWVRRTWSGASPHLGEPSSTRAGRRPTRREHDPMSDLNVVHAAQLARLTDRGEARRGPSSANSICSRMAQSRSARPDRRGRDHRRRCSRTGTTARRRSTRAGRPCSPA